MIDLIKTWILSVASAAFITGIALSLTPQGKLRKVVSLVCGFLTIAVMLGPLKSFDMDSYSEFMVVFNNQSEEYGLSLENENERLVKAIIEERSAAYILDKAMKLGIQNLDVTVDTKVGEGDYPHPWGAELRGEATEEQKQSLGQYIESELGIPADRQYWSE